VDVSPWWVQSIRLAIITWGAMSIKNRVKARTLPVTKKKDVEILSEIPTLCLTYAVSSAVSSKDVASFTPA